MRIEIILSVSYLVCLIHPLPVHSSNIPITVIQDYLPCEVCLTRVLQQSHAQHIRLVCASNTTLCPIHALSRIPRMSWMIINRTIQGEYADERDFCVTAANTVRQLRVLIGQRKVCSTQKIIIVLPDRVARNSNNLKIFFRQIWRNVITEVVAILLGLQCRVFSLVPSDEPNTVPADQTLTLTNSRERNKTCSLNDTGVTYFPNKIPQLQ